MAEFKVSGSKFKVNAVVRLCILYTLNFER